jgi:group II intron reverse transcriptase/maturase
MRENREISPPPGYGIPGRIGKAEGRNPMKHGGEKSDGSVVPAKLPNKAGRPTAEVVEGRDPAKGNSGQTDMCRTQGRDHHVPSGLDRVRKAARKDREAKFTALLHHVDIDLLREAYCRLRRKAAPGVDGVTWEDYGRDLETNLADLHGRVHRGGYRAKPSRRTFIPKADGRQRPLGIAALEDKIVQRAVVEVLNAIYEEDFLGFSYGFRPGRSQHQALDALTVAIKRKQVNWVLDADIRGFFDAIDHECLMRFVEHRIADKRILRLVRKWLVAGVMENGEWTKGEEGTPQGATISPLLANLYLHYVLDLWVHQWRKQRARGDLIITRYADDFVVGFQHREDAADRIRAACRRRSTAAGTREAGDIHVPRVHPHLREDPSREVSGAAAHERETHASETERGQGRTQTPHAPSDPRARGVATCGRGRLLPLSRGADQHRRPDDVPQAGYTSLASHAETAQPEDTPDLGAHGRDRYTLAAAREDHTPMARNAFRRQNPRQEPSALAALAGICAGGRA